MRSIQLYGTGSGTATAVAQITVPSKGVIVACQVSLLVDCVTDNGSVRLELSPVPTNQVAVNGAQDPFLEIGAYVNLATSGLAAPLVSQNFPLVVQVDQGEIIYLHATVAGTVTYYFNGILWIK
jgi:hypothetical protein